MSEWRTLQERWARIPPGTVPTLVVLASLLVGVYVVLKVLVSLLLQ